jgi:hypothetical protein
MVTVLRFGGRVFADGRVHLYVDDELVIEGSASDLPFVGERGRIGVFADSDITALAWDDFGGGSFTCP